LAVLSVATERSLRQNEHAALVQEDADAKVDRDVQASLLDMGEKSNANKRVIRELQEDADAKVDGDVQASLLDMGDEEAERQQKVGCGCGWANAGNCGNDDGTKCNRVCCEQYRTPKQTAQPDPALAMNKKNVDGLGDLREFAATFKAGAAKSQNNIRNAFNSKLSLQVNNAQMVSKTANEDHDSNQFEFDRTVPTITKIQAEAESVLQRAEEEYAGMDTTAGAKIKEAMAAFDIQADAAGTSYHGTASQNRDLANGKVAQQRKMMEDETTRQHDWIVTFGLQNEAAATSQADQFEKVQGQYKDKFEDSQKAFDDMSEEQQTLKENQDFALGAVMDEAEQLSDNGDQKSPGLEQKIDHAEEVFDNFETTADSNIEMYEDEVDDELDAFDATVEKQGDLASKQAEGMVDVAEAAVKDQGVTGEIEAKAYGMNVVKNAKTQQAAMAMALPFLPTIEKALTSYGETIESIKGTNEESLGKMFSDFDDTLHNFGETYKDKLKKDSDNTFLGEKSMLANVRNTMLSKVAEATNNVNADGLAKVQQSQLTFDSFLSSHGTSVDAAKNKIGEQVAKVEESEKTLAATKKEISKIALPVENMEKIKTAFNEQAQAVAASSTFAAQESTGRLGELVKRSGDAIKRAISIGNEQMSEASTRLTKGIGEQSADVMGDISELSQKGVQTSAEIRGRMLEAERIMRNAEEIYGDAVDYTQSAPGDMIAFKDTFSGKLESTNFSFGTMQEQTSDETKAAFEQATEKAHNTIQNTKSTLSSFIKGEAKRVSEQAVVQQDTAKRIIADGNEARENRIKGQNTITMVNEKLVNELSNFNPTIDEDVARAQKELVATNDKIAYNLAKLKQQKTDVGTQMLTTGSKADQDYKLQVAGVLTAVGGKLTEQVSELQLGLERQQKNAEDEAVGQKTLIEKQVTDAEANVLKPLDASITKLGAIFSDGKLDMIMNDANHGLTNAENGEAGALESAKEITKIGDKTKMDIEKQVADEQDGFDGARETMKTSLKSGVDSLHLSETKEATDLKEKVEETKRDSSQTIETMSSEALNTKTGLEGENRKVKMGADSLTELLQSETGDIKSKINNELKDVAGHGSDSLNEAKHEKEEVEAAKRQLDREAESMSESNKALERDTLNEIEGLNPTTKTGELRDEVENLAAIQKQDVTDEVEAVENANSAVAKILKGVDEKIVSLGQEVGKKNQRITFAANDVSKKLVETREQVDHDSEDFNVMLQSMTDMTSDMKRHVERRESEVKKKVTNNERILANMQGMTKYSDANVLEKVTEAVDNAATQDSGILNQVNEEVKPEASKWQEGIQQVLSNLGMELDIDKVFANAEKRQDAEKKAREEMERGTDDLTASIQEQEEAGRMKQEAIMAKSRADIEKIMQDASLSQEEKMERIAEISMRAKSDSQAVMDATTRQADGNLAAQNQIDGQRMMLGTLMERAKIAATGAARGPDRRDLAAQTAEIKAHLKSVGRSLEKPPPVGINDEQTSSLLEEHSASSVDDIKTVDKALGDKTLREEQETADWEKQLLAIA